MSERTTRDKKSGLSLGDKSDPIGIGKIIDKSSIHAGLRDFDKKCYKHGSGATLQYTLTDQNAPKCSVLKSWTGGLCVYTFLSISLALSVLWAPCGANK